MTDHHDESILLSRRLLLTGTAALGAAAALPLAAAQAASPDSAPGLLPREGTIPADHASRAGIIRRVRLRSDAGPVFWWFRGRNYAQQGANLIPLCDMIFGAVMDVRPLPDGGLEILQYELGFRMALDSAKRAEQLLNPITGAMVDVPFAPVGPTRLRYTAENVLDLPDMIGGTKFTFEHVPEVFYQIGDQVCFQTHTRSRASTPGVTDRVLNDMSMICSPAREALDRSRGFASAWAHGSDVTDYARWLKMPAGAGTQTLRSIGQKAARFEDMPDDWRSMLAAADPDMARDPIAGLRRPAATYRN